MTRPRPTEARDSMDGAAGPLVHRVNAAAASAMLVAIGCYKRFVSPLLGRNCRFEPTCSEYFAEAVRKHGPWRGAARGIGRICRCHPWSRGGYDPP